MPRLPAAMTRSRSRGPEERLGSGVEGSTASVGAFSATTPWTAACGSSRRRRWWRSRWACPGVGPGPAHPHARLVASPPPGGLEALLARTLGDPSLTLLYPLPDGRRVDRRPVELGRGQKVTPLVRGQQPMALL